MCTATCVCGGSPWRTPQSCLALLWSAVVQATQQWAMANVLGPEDELHLVSVALPVPYQVGGRGVRQGARVRGASGPAGLPGLILLLAREDWRAWAACRVGPELRQGIKAGAGAWRR